MLYTRNTTIARTKPWLSLALVAMLGLFSPGNLVFPVSAVAQVSTAISGVVRDGNNDPLANTVVSLGGLQSGTTTTGASGQFSFTNLAAGLYTVTPQSADLMFSPPTQAVSTLLGNQTGINFSGISNPLMNCGVSGRLVNPNGDPLSGVAVNLSGAQTATTATAANGSFSFANLTCGGNYTVTPASANLTFNPSSLNVNALTGTQNLSNIVGTSSVPSGAINGRIVNANGDGVGGVTVTLGGAQSGTTTTGADGTFSFPGLGAGTFMITPSSGSFVLAPSSQIVSNPIGTVTLPNILATPIPSTSFTIGGRLIDSSGNPIAGTTVNLGGSRTGTATTGADGSFSFPGLASGGSFTVTPQNASFSFNPPTTLVSNLTGDVGLPTIIGSPTAVPTATIRGMVTDGNGNPLAGTTIRLNGSQSGMTQTGADGSFSFAGLVQGGNFTITPSGVGLMFVPGSTIINNLQGDQILSNFIGAMTANTFQFAPASYAVSEDVTSVAVTVTRSGDTASAASVEYGSQNGAADEKGDYTTTVGTLRFAPGETDKSFDVLITEDSRSEGPESFTLTLTNPEGDTALGNASTATITVIDDVTEPTANANRDTGVFVGMQYHDFLNRQADSSGLAFWSNEINQCNSDPACLEPKRINTSAAFYLSSEFQETGSYVIRVNRAAFGHQSNSASTRLNYREFLKDAQEVGEGVVVGQAGSEQKIESNNQAYAERTVSSPQFMARYPDNMSATEYVDALYAGAAVTPTSTERQEAINAYSDGGMQGRAAALRKVADSTSIRRAEFNAAFVLLQYFGYLRRNPTDAPDGNDDGYQFWLSKLNQFGGDFVTSEMVKAFLVSEEYTSRFGPPTNMP